MLPCPRCSRRRLIDASLGSDIAVSEVLWPERLPDPHALCRILRHGLTTWFPFAMRGYSDTAVEDEPGARTRAGRYRAASNAAGEAMERRRLEQELRHTLSLGGFVLHYQPLIVLATGAVMGGEALIR